MGDDLGPVPAVPERDRDDEAGPSEPEVLASIAAQAGLRRIHFVAWRDLDDPEAGGSELHAHQIASIWASGGLDVSVHTSRVAGVAPSTSRDGYRVLRQGGRLSVYPRTILGGLVGRGGLPDGYMEIWHGMP